MIALGIDPGTRHLGWGVVRADGNRMRHIAHGVISPRTGDPLHARLSVIDSALGEVLERYQPAVGSVETLFFHKDAQAAAKLGHARGVVLLNLARAGVAVAEYPPAQVKRTIVGKGQADKRQMQMMMRTLLALDDLPPSDAADALALAVTHLRRAPLEAALTAQGSPAAEVLRRLSAGKRKRRPRRPLVSS